MMQHRESSGLAEGRRFLNSVLRLYLSAEDPTNISKCQEEAEAERPGWRPQPGKIKWMLFFFFLNIYILTILRFINRRMLASSVTL